MDSKAGNDLVKCVENFEQEGRMFVGKPKKTWGDPQEELKNKGFIQAALYPAVWWTAVSWQRLTHVNIECTFQNDDGMITALAIIWGSYLNCHKALKTKIES